MSDSRYLVDGKYGIRDLVDLDELRRVFERFTEATGFTIGFLDHPGMNVLIATGWRSICTEFHRAFPSAAAHCTESNRRLLINRDEPGKLQVAVCENGLVDCAFPIIVKGTHIANLATGQLLTEPPDLERFRRQAATLGFDEEKYLRALAEVPVVSEEKLRSVTTFLGEMALLLSQLGYARLQARDDAERLAEEVAIRTRAEQSLAAERERLLVTLRSIGDGVITADTDGRIVLMNRVAEDLTGWSLAEGVGRPLRDVLALFDERTRQPYGNPADDILRAGPSAELSNCSTVMSRSGREIPIEANGAAIRDHSGTTVGVVLVFRDVSDRRRSESTLRTTQKLRSLGVLAGGIAHDFNNYLGGILGHVDLAIDSAKAGDTAQSAHELDQVADIVAQAKGLTQRLLTFARGEKPVLRPGPITDFVRQVATFATSGSTVALDFQAGSDVPPCSYDSNQMDQVVQNLVLNAIQAMPDGGTVRVSVEKAELDRSHVSLPPGTYVRVSVADHGVGIPAEAIPHIFDPFFSTKDGGSGLGLAICYSIAKKHDGLVEATSQPGRGSTFTLYLPAGLQSPPATVPLKPERRVHHGCGTALVMDDLESIRTVASCMLQRMGYETVVARNGVDALRILSEKPCQLALLDLTIPGGMGGIETVHEIRQRFASAAPTVVAMSGYSEAQVMSDPVTFGFDASIAKPFTMAALSSLLDSVVERVASPAPV